MGAVVPDILEQHVRQAACEFGGAKISCTTPLPRRDSDRGGVGQRLGQADVGRRDGALGDVEHVDGADDLVSETHREGVDHLVDMPAAHREQAVPTAR
jgi:hypothetical protein